MLFLQITFFTPYILPPPCINTYFPTPKSMLDWNWKTCNFCRLKFYTKFNHKLVFEIFFKNINHFSSNSILNNIKLAKVHPNTQSSKQYKFFYVKYNVPKGNQFFHSQFFQNQFYTNLRQTLCLSTPTKKKYNSTQLVAYLQSVQV